MRRDFAIGLGIIAGLGVFLVIAARREQRPQRRRPRDAGRRTLGAAAARLSSKDPKTMTPGQINTELDKLDKITSTITDEFIAAGRGHEKAWDIVKMDDPLALRYRAAYDRRSAIRREMEHRYGPSAQYLHHLPRGFKKRA